MRTRSRNPFITVKTAGLLLPIDLLARIVDGDSELPGLKPESYHLLPGERLNEAASRAWNACLSAWKSFRQAAATLPASDAGTTLTRNRWLLALFREFGYGQLQPQTAIEIEDKSYPISHGWGEHVPIHLVSFRYELERRTPGASGAATRSPYSVMQELLNRSSKYRWGFLSNGLRLFVLRDNASLSRAANVEFDLEAMFDGEVYADFLLLFLICHQSRVEIPPEGKPEDCWLEKWSAQADKQGVAAREKLRVGVEEAIKALGAGFLTTNGNHELHERLRSGNLPTQDYYRQLLRLVYRLLLLLVAEEKRTEDGQNLLHPPSTSEAARQRYAKYYSIGRLRTLAAQRRGTSHVDLYESLKVLFEKLRSGYEPLGIPGLGSFLFSDHATVELDAARLSNEAMLNAIRALCITEDTSGKGGTVRRPVDFANLGSDELGSVYESLLELHPRLDPFTLDTASGNERKTTGSYYTPTSLINCLLDSALDPVVRETLNQPDTKQAERALLKLKICDPACGSGHFLIAASDRLARQLASLRTGDDEPSALIIQHAKRDIISHCIYGVDINPMSVELCKVALWMEAMEPGKPLSFLDHHIQCGNSLLGTTPVLLAKGIPDDAFTAIEGDVKARVTELKKQNKKERDEHKKGQGYLFEPFFKLGNIAADFARLNAAPDGTLAEVAALQDLYARLVNSSEYASTRLLADTWCAAFVWKKDDSELGKMSPTERDFRKVESHAGAGLLPHVREEVERLRDQYQFFHWHLAFPDVFRLPAKDETPENEQTGWSGGFDVMLGNPPWEMIEQETATEPVPTVRRSIAGQQHFLSHGDMFRLTSSGRKNLYALFAELVTTVQSRFGRVGVVLPTGIVHEEPAETFAKAMFAESRVASVFDFQNKRKPPAKGKWFEDVHPQYRISLVTFARGSLTTRFLFDMDDVYEIEDESRAYSQSLAEIENFCSTAFKVPMFRSVAEARILSSAYSYGRTIGDLCRPGKASLKSGLMFNFGPVEKSKKVALTDRAATLVLRVFEGEYIHQFNHRFATVSDGRVRDTTDDERELPEFLTVTADYLPADFTENRLRQMADRVPKWAVLLRRQARSTDSMICISAVVPQCASEGNVTVFFEQPEEGCRAALLCALFNSFILNYVTCLRQSGPNLNKGIYEQLPVIPLLEGKEMPKSLSREWFVARVLELTYTAWDLEPFARDCGYAGPPFRWDEARRFLLRAELDAAFFHLYGLNREDTAYILDTFPIVRRKDIEKHGEYRTQRVILEIYDALAEATRSGQPYQTRLDPPPADPRVAHPPREGTAPSQKLEVVDPTYPQTTLEKTLVACLLDFVRMNAGLSVEQCLDAVLLMMQKARCRILLDGKQPAEFDRAVQRVLPELVADPNGRPQWRLLLQAAVMSRALEQTDGTLEQGENFEKLRNKLPEVPHEWLQLVSAAAEKLRDLQSDATPIDGANAALASLVAEIKTNREMAMAA